MNIYSVRVNWLGSVNWGRSLSLGPFTYYVITEKGAGVKIIKSLYFIIEKKWAGGKNPKIVTTLYVNGPIRVWPCSKFGNIVCRKVSNSFFVAKMITQCMVPSTGHL